MDTTQQTQLAAILGSDFPNSGATSLSGVSVGSSGSSGIGTSRTSSSASKHEEDVRRDEEVFTRRRFTIFIFLIFLVETTRPRIMAVFDKVLLVYKLFTGVHTCSF